MAGRQSLLVGLALVALGVLTSAAAASAQKSPDRKFNYTHRGMGTIVSLTVWADAGKQAEVAVAAKAAFDELDRVERMMSSWTDEGDISAINSNAGKKAVVVAPEVFAVIERAQKMARTSGGAFDITIGSFRGLWKFDQDRDGSIPSDADVKARRKLVGYRDVALNKRRRTVKLRKKGQRITLGGIAKGYAVDRAVKLLHEKGFLDFILQAGGDLYVSGHKSGTSWTVGIRDPRSEDKGASFALTALKDKTFSTSGDYERAVIKDGVRYHHLLDPKTGRPAKGARSVTVIADDAITADIWSTSLFVLGTTKGLALANKTKGIEAVFVDDKNQIHVTAGLKLVRAKRGMKPTVGTIFILRDPTPGI